MNGKSGLMSQVLFLPRLFSVQNCCHSFSFFEASVFIALFLRLIFNARAFNLFCPRVT